MGGDLRGDLPAVHRRYRGVAGLDAAPVQQHRAASAHASAAPETGALELQVVAQDIEERRARLCGDDAARAVGVEFDALGQASSPCTPSLGRAGHFCHAAPGRAEIVATHR
jgi:hypothetical protein